MGGLWGAGRHVTRQGERGCTDGAQRQPVGVTGADRVRVEEDKDTDAAAVRSFVPETAPRPICRVVRSSPNLPHHAGRAMTRLRAADPQGILRARAAARVAPGVGLGNCAH
jgi:hypothetical protein